MHSVWRLECEVLIKTLLKASLSFWLLNLMLTQKLHSEALARKRKEEKKRKERKGVCERSCSWARAASGAVVHSSSSSSWQKQRVLAFAWWGWWTTLQYRQGRWLFSIFHILSNCVRDKWSVNNFTESAWKASFFCKVVALRLELGERNKRLTLSSVWWEQLSLSVSLLTDKWSFFLLL